MKLVVDNSVVMRWLFKDGSDADRSYAGRVAAAVETSEVHVPALFIAEAANVISRAVKAGVISRDDCTSFFNIINAMEAQVSQSDSTRDVAYVAMKAWDGGAVRLRCQLFAIGTTARLFASHAG